MAKIDLTITGLKEAKADLEKLNAEFEKVKNDPIKSKKIAKEFNDLSKAVDEATSELTAMNAAGKLLGVRFDDLQETLFGVREEVLPLTSQIGEMEDRMYQLAAAGQAGNEEFVALQKETARLRKVIIDTDKSVDLLAENQGLSIFATGLGQVGESILRLDFATAQKDAAALNNAIGNLGQIGANSIKGLIGTVGQLSKAFVKLGVALLANPIFLIVAAVTAIVVAIGALLDKLGFLQPILDAIGEAFAFVGQVIDTVVQSIKDFLDALGLTDFKVQETANKLTAAFEKIGESSKARLKDVQADFDLRIRLAQIEGQETTELERQKQQAIIESLNVQRDVVKERIKLNEITGKLSEDELKTLKDTLKEQEDAILNARAEIKVIDAQEIKDQQEKHKKLLDDQRKYNEARLSATRQIRDLELDLIEDGINKELALNQEKYKRLIEDTKRNEQLLQKEKLQIIELLREAENQRRIEIEQGFIDQTNKLLEEAEQKRAEDRRLSEEKIAQMRAEFNEKARQQAQEQYDILLAQQQAYNEARLNLGDSLVKGLTGLEQLLAASGVKTAGLQKVIALIQIATDTAKAISATIAGATAAAAAGGPAAPFLLAGYIASGIGTVLSAVAAAKNALQSAPSLPGVPSGSGGASLAAPNVSATTPAQPSFNLFGQNNNANNLSAPQDVEQQDQEITVKAVVSETEITSTQNKIKKLTESAAL